MAAVLGTGVVLGALSTPAAAADGEKGYRHSSGLVVLPSIGQAASSMSEATATLLSEARDLQESYPADFGYPFVDDAGTVIVSVANQSGDDRYAKWHPSMAGAGHKKRDGAVSAERFERIRDDIAAQESKHAKGFDHIVMVAPDPANNRLILTVNSIDDESLGILAKRYGTELVAVRYEPNDERPTLTSGRFNDLSSPGGFYAGSAIRVDVNSDPYDHLCSTAFSWRSLDNSISYMLTAGHCADQGGLVWTATGDPNWSTVESMGSVTADTRENWDSTAGTTHLVGDLASASAYRGDIALIQVLSGKTSSGYVYADPGRYSRPVKEFWTTWSATGQQFCTDGVQTREMCGWKVTAVGVDVTYADGTVFRGGNRASKQGQCTIAGDSGGPIYTVRSDGGVAAKGIISGGGGGGSDHWGGLFDPCTLTYTDIRDPWLGLPGTVALA